MVLTHSPTATVGANVRAEMARRRVPQRVLADRLGLTQPAISKRLAGVTPFDVNELALIAELLGVSVLDLLQPFPESVPA